MKGPLSVELPACPPLHPQVAAPRRTIPAARNQEQILFITARPPRACFLLGPISIHPSPGSMQPSCRPHAAGQPSLWGRAPPEGKNTILASSPVIEPKENEFLPSQPALDRPGPGPSPPRAATRWNAFSPPDLCVPFHPACASARGIYASRRNRTFRKTLLSAPLPGAARFSPPIFPRKKSTPD